MDYSSRVIKLTGPEWVIRATTNRNRNILDKILDNVVTVGDKFTHPNWNMAPVAANGFNYFYAMAATLPHSAPIYYVTWVRRRRASERGLITIKCARYRK